MLDLTSPDKAHLMTPVSFARVHTRAASDAATSMRSIDPPGCTDVDDALHVRRLHHEPSSRQTGKGSGGRGLVEVGVHIADVSHFVRAGGMLDGEARDR